MAAVTQDGVDRSAVRASPAPARQPPDADASSETSSVHSGETSDRRDADILTLVLSTRSEEYRLLFRLPPDEVLVQDFNCAFQENILLQGHMYLFIHHICFYSNIFGFETKKTIHFREVTCVRKAKTAAIFHNAIEIVAGGKKHFFGSFLSRDEAYRLIIDGWAQHNSEIKAFQENQDLKSEISSQENDMVCPKGSRLLGDDPSSSGRTKDDIIWNEPKISPIGEVDGKLTINITEDKENGREENTKLLITENTLTWIVEDVDAPKVPDHFTVVAEAKFPVLVEDFFSFFVSDNSFKFVEDFHKTCGDKDFQCTPWQKHEQFGHVRDVSFLHPIKVYLGAKSGHCQEVQKYRVYKNSHLMIETSQQIGDVPFGDYFHVEGIWDVEEDNDGKSCTLRVYSNVAFSKKTIFRGKIEQSTREECREVYAKWINLAHELLKKKKRRQSKGNEQTMSMVQPNGRQVLENSQNINGSVEKLHPTCSSRDIPLDMHNSRNQKPDINPGGLSTMVSLFPQSWATVVSYVKAQSPSALVLFVAFLASMILMQMSIIVLLTRAPEVHLVSHRNDLSDIDRYSLENIEWIEKHFRYLKEEMFMVETRMERMRHEYALLKAHLQRLEHMKSKS